jgi:hypothetical protein
MREMNTLWFVYAGIGVLAVFLVVALVRRSRRLHDLLAQIVAEFGWEGTRRSWWNGALRARWRGYDVELRHMDRYKGIPERIHLTVKCQSPARLIIKHRSNFLMKPITMFGPPIVEPANITERDQYWIRCDEPVFAETLFTHHEVEPALATNLIAGYDTVDLEPKRLRVLRAIDDSVVKRRFGRPFFRWGRDLDLIETITREAWALTVIVVASAGVRPSY